MNKIETYQAQIRAADAKIAEVKAKAETEKRDYTAEEQATLRAQVDEIKSLKGKIDLERDIEAAASSASPRIEVHDVADEAPYSFGEFLQDVAFASVQNGERRPRLAAHQKRSVDAVRKEFRAAATGMGEALPADGGFLVGTDFATGLMTRVYENSVLAPRCQKVTISGGSNSIKINGINETSRANGSRYGGVLGYWVGEGVAPTASKPKFREIELVLKKLGVLAYSTDELLQDAAALGQVVSTCVVGELDFMLQDALINGNGAGKPLGVLKGPCLVTIDEETGQAADTIVLKNISKMWAALWAPSRANAVWLINQEIEPQLDLLSVPVGTGGMPVYMPPGGLADSPYGRLKGRPVIAIEQAAALGDAGDIILADFSQYILADKGGIQAASSMHVAFTAGETVYRFIYRVDGQPSWNSALTPYKGAQTQSPFVTLAARA